MTDGKSGGASGPIEFYDRLADTYEAARFASFKNIVDKRHEEAIIARFVRLAPGEKALDVGSGTGRIASLIAGRFPSIIMVEPAKGMLRHLGTSGRLERGRVIRSDASHLPFKDSTFD